jgi:hypothetical protein
MAFLVAIACGQIAVGVLAFARAPWRRLGYFGAIVFLLAITPLGIGAAVPSRVIFACGIGLLLWEKPGRGGIEISGIPARRDEP